MQNLTFNTCHCGQIMDNLLHIVKFFAENNEFREKCFLWTVTLYLLCRDVHIDEGIISSYVCGFKITNVF